MAGSFSNSWTLVKASANVLRLDKELVVFPLLSGIAAILVTVSFIAPLAVTGGWEIFAEGEDASYVAYTRPWRRPWAWCSASSPNAPAPWGDSPPG
jgi:hypothetical protein